MSSETTTLQVRRLQTLWTQTLLEYVTTAALTTDGRLLAVGTADGVVTVYDRETGEPVQQWQDLHPLGVLSLAWSADGAILASGGQDAYIWLLSADQAQPLAKLNGGGAWVEHLAWHAREPQLLSAAGKQLKLWQADGTPLFEFSPHDHTISGLAWHPGLPKQLATATYNGVRRYEVSKANPLRKFGWKSALQQLVWSPDAKVLATSTQDAAVHVWYAKTGEDLHMGGYPCKIKTMAWSPDSRYLAVAGGVDVTLWDFSGRGPAGTEPLLLSAHTEPVTVLAYHSNGKRLVTGSEDGQVFVWQPEKLKAPALVEPLFAAPLPDAITQIIWFENTIIATTESGEVIALKASEAMS